MDKDVKKELEKNNKEKKEFAKAREMYYKREKFLLENKAENVYRTAYEIDEFTGEEKPNGLTKYIVWVKTKEEAEELKKALKEALHTAKMSVSNKKDFTLNRKIKVFETSEIRLKIKPSYQTKKNIKYADLIKFVKDEIERNKICPAWFINEFVDEKTLSFVKNDPIIKNAKLFTRRLYTGHKYEISCFDEVFGETLTECLGNIVIIISDKQPKFSQGTTVKKSRSDGRVAVLQTASNMFWYVDE